MTESPRPTPRPGPRPGPKPGPRPSAPVQPVVPPAAETALRPVDPSRYGRIADDGTVYLFTEQGEREIASWQAGTPAEGLAHFGRRYDDLSTEVGLLEDRLRSGSADPVATKEAAEHLLAGLDEAAVLGDVPALARRLTAVIDGCGEAADRARAKRSEQRAAQLARKQELAAEAEQIAADSTQWKVAGDRLREILDEWKTLRGIDRKTDDALWKRYSKAREAFNRRRGAHFAELDRNRVVARERKEELVVQAEALADSTDWGPTSRAYRDLMAQWKAAGRAPREADDALWQRFKAAQDTFFGARKAADAEIDREYEHNAQVKEELLREAEALSTDDLETARRRLGEIQDRWEQAGKVPRAKMHSIESRMRAVEQRVRDAADAQWRRTDPEAMARAAQFRSRVEQFEQQAEKAEQAGKTKAAAEARAQAAQWREWADAAETAVEDR